MTSIGQYRLRYDDETGEVELEGTARPPGVRVVAHRGSLIAAKHPGTHVYGGQGRPFTYRGGRFEVYEVIREDGEGWLLVQPVISWPVTMPAAAPRAARATAS